MEKKKVTRRLRAILSADVQGYSRLMEDDEVATVETITEYRETISSLVTQYNGRVVDSPGDNILAEFASVVDAVQCAVEIQNILKAKNEDLPANRRMIFRIGVNIGDVIQEGDRIYGDGVNIAARLESLAEGGGICISGTAYDHIGNKLALGYNFIGEHIVKNIAKPVRVYKVPMEPGERNQEKTLIKKPQLVAIAVVALILVLAGATFWNFYLRSSSPSIEPAAVEKMALALPDNPSIAVLPFSNIAGDPKEQYLCDGFTEQIITVLAKTPGLIVTASNTSFTFKGQSVNVQQVGKDLGVRYVLEGSVQKSGARLRVTAQLIDAATGNHLWAEKYDQDLEDIFDMQNEIALKIMQSLQMNLVGGTTMNPCARVTTNVAAYLKFLQAIHFSNMGTVDGLYLGRQMCEQAIELDPDYGPGYGLLALTYLDEVGYCVSKSPKQSVAKAFELAAKALSASNDCPFSRMVMGYVYMFMGQNDKAVEEMKAAIAMDPNWPNGYVGLAFSLRDWNEAIELIEKALRLNPLPLPWYFASLGRAYGRIGKYEEAIAAYKRGLEKAPDYFWCHIGLAYVYTILGSEEDARFEVDEALKINPHYSLACMGPIIQSFDDEAVRNRLIESMRKAGLE